MSMIHCLRQLCTLLKSLLQFIRKLQLKDLWFAKNIHIEYTYIRENIGARIDRTYARDLYNNVKSIKAIHVNFSDHSSIITEIETSNIPKTGKCYTNSNLQCWSQSVTSCRFQTRVKIHLSK